MSHQYAHHAHHAHSKTPAAAIVPASGLLDYEPEDDTVYKRRYFALKNLVHALEDENNMLALKLAQITIRCRDAEIARLRSLEKSHLASLARSQSRQTSQVSPAQAHPSDSRVRQSRSASIGGGQRKTSGKRGAMDVDMNMDSHRGDSRARGYSEDEDLEEVKRARDQSASAHRALEDLMDEPSGTSGVRGGGKPRSKGSAAAINDLIDEPDFDGPPRGGRAGYGSADPRQSGSADTDSQMDMDADDY